MAWEVIIFDGDNVFLKETFRSVREICERFDFINPSDVYNWNNRNKGKWEKNKQKLKHLNIKKI